MAFFLQVMTGRKVSFAPQVAMGVSTARPAFGNAGGKAAVSGGKGTGTEVYALPVVTSTYTDEIERICGSVRNALDEFALLPARSAWSSLGKSTQDSLTVKYWTVSDDGKPGEKAISPEYLTKLRLSVYSCIDAEQESIDELAALRLVMSLDRLCRRYFLYTTTLKDNDAVAKTQRKMLDQIDELDAHGAVFASETAASAAA